MRRGRRVLVGAGALGVCLLTGCTAGSGRAQPSSHPPTTSAPSQPPATSTATSTAAAPAALPDNCGVMLPITELDAALGVGLPGSVSYVRGQPLPEIGRTDRITCGYGVVVGADGVAQPALLEVSIATYADPTAAADRIQVTVADRQSQGDRADPVPLGANSAVLLTGVTQSLLVFADGERTYSLTLLPGVVGADQTGPALTAVAQVLLDRAAAPT